MTCMPLGVFSTRLQRLVGSKSKAAATAAKEKGVPPTLQISAPFNFKHEAISLPGLSEDEITALKEKAAASRLGSADSNNDGASAFGSPRKAPPTPQSPTRPAVPAVLVTPGTPLSPQDNVF